MKAMAMAAYSILPASDTGDSECTETMKSVAPAAGEGGGTGGVMGSETVPCATQQWIDDSVHLSGPRKDGTHWTLM